MINAHRAYFKKIDSILVTEWNPIGFPVPADEYTAYVPKLFQQVLAGVSEEELAVELHELALGINEHASMALSQKAATLILRERPHFI